VVHYCELSDNSSEGFILTPQNIEQSKLDNTQKADEDKHDGIDVVLYSKHFGQFGRYLIGEHCQQQSAEPECKAQASFN
jgi:hypothetical protein